MEHRTHFSPAKKSAFGVVLVLLMSLQTNAGTFEEADLAALLRDDPKLAKVASEAEKYRLQVLVGLVEEAESGQTILRQISFRADAEYFYPASSIKLFAAVVALEKLEQLRQETSKPIDVDTGLIFHPLFADEEWASKDLTNLEDGRITLRHEIRKLFLVSDNQAFNHLYDLIGQSALNHRLREIGLRSTQIVHRLSMVRSIDENLRTPKIELIGPDLHHVLEERELESALIKADVRGLDVGKGYLAAGERHDKAMDFRAKNRMSLVDLQRGLCKVVRPDVDVGGEDFRLNEAQRELLLKAMSQYPRQSRNPRYDAEAYPDEWAKFLLPGLCEILPQNRLQIANKIGRAYGFSVENAWVLDRKTGLSFFLAATLYTNEDGILNDDQYEYDTIADPFLAALGKAVARALWNL